MITYSFHSSRVCSSQCRRFRASDRHDKNEKYWDECIDYKQSLIFLRDSRVGEDASARENHIEETRSTARALPLDYPWEKWGTARSIYLIFRKVTGNDHSSTRKLACVAVVSFPRACEARKKSEKKRRGEPHHNPHSRFFPPLFRLRAFVRLPRSRKGNDCYAGYKTTTTKNERVCENGIVIAWHVTYSLIERS